jgi:hypothetical protein
MELSKLTEAVDTILLWMPQILFLSLVISGRHRLVIAQKIGIKEILAILPLIHPDAHDKLQVRRRRVTGNPGGFYRF